LLDREQVLAFADARRGILMSSKHPHSD
jgi:hypothetical protein